MFFQGVGQLFPWNAFITAAAYFGTRFCTTAFSTDFENYLSIAFTASQTIGLALTLLYGNKFNYHQKIVYPLLIYAGIFAVVTALVLVVDVNPTGLFWMTFMSCVLCGLFGAFLNAGFFSLGAVFPPAYTGAMMSGQGLAGMTVSIASIVSQAAGPMTEGFCSGEEEITGCADYVTNYSAFSYFMISTVVLLSCVILFYVLMKLPFTIYNMRINGQLEAFEPLLATENPINSNDSSANSSYNASFSSGRTSDYIPSDVVNNAALSLSGITKRNEKDGDNSADYEVEGGTGIGQSQPGGAVSFKDSKLVTGESDRHSLEKSMADAMGITSIGEIKRVFNTIRVPALSVFFVFTVTISIFPALTVTAISDQNCQTNERFFNDLFVPFLFVLFNIGDFSGRILAATFPYFTAENIWLPSAARCIFYPLFLLCNIKGTKLPVVFQSDFWPILFMIAFGTSNGYVSSCSMMLGPTIVSPQDAPLAGNIMIFCLTAGLMAGSTLAFVITLISQGHID